MTEPRVALWEAINRYVVACGGDPDRAVHGNIKRMQAVVDVEMAADQKPSIEARSETGFARLQKFCATYGSGYTLVAGDPFTADDAIGVQGASRFAQLCGGGRVVAFPAVDALYSVAHEVAHGEVARLNPGASEDAVFQEQMRFLVEFAKALLMGWA